MTEYADVKDGAVLTISSRLVIEDSMGLKIEPHRVEVSINNGVYLDSKMLMDGINSAVKRRLPDIKAGIEKTCENCKWSKPHNCGTFLVCNYNAPVEYFPKVGTKDFCKEFTQKEDV